MTLQGQGRHSAYRWKWVWSGALAVVVGAGLLGVALSRADGWSLALGELPQTLVGWGGFTVVLRALAEVGTSKAVQNVQPVELPLTLGTLAWVVGWALIALGIGRDSARPVAIPSDAVGAPLNPRLSNYRDFYWSTLGAYGGGILGAELALIVTQLLLAGSSGSRAGLGSGEVAELPAASGFSPLTAFSIAVLVAFGTAFAGGALGAWRARRLAIPELTLAVIYFGLPLPILLTLMHRVPTLSLALGFRLREVTYLAGLLGRPELGYWLVFAGLVLALFLGITSGFVATSSGKLNLRVGYELFVATRHVQVYRPSLLVGALLVLLLGIIPPLLIYAILVAAEAAVERTRIRALGLADPLKASEALSQLRDREQSPTAMMTALAVGGVGVGVMALIIVLSVMSGFEIDLQSKMLGTNAHAVVTRYSGSMAEYPEVIEKAKQVSGVVGATPFILNEVMIASEGNVSGTMIKGVDVTTLGTVTDLPKYMLPGGSLEALDHPETIGRQRRVGEDAEAFGAAPRAGDLDDMLVMPEPDAKETVLPGIILGRELAAALKVLVGDRLNIVSPLGGELGPQGPMPKSRPFRVAGLFSSGMYEFDSKFAYIRLEEAQSFFNVKGATGIELKVADVDDARRIARAVYDKLDGYPYRAKDWGEMNRNLFSALRLEKLIMAIILSIIIIVASGLIVATVIMLVLEKRKEIAVLKALGVPDGGIVKIFLAEGLQIGVTGGLLGLLAGLAWCLFLERVGIKLDPEIYYIPSLPVKVEPVQTAISVVVAVMVSFLASLYPALKASRVEPVDGLKAE